MILQTMKILWKKPGLLILHMPPQRHEIYCDGDMMMECDIFIICQSIIILQKPKRPKYTQMQWNIKSAHNDDDACAQGIYNLIHFLAS